MASGVSDVSFNLLKLEYAQKKDILLDYYQKAATFLIDVYTVLKRENIHENLISRKVFGLINNIFAFSDCAASAMNQITVDTNGDLYNCQCNMCSERKLGNIFSLNKQVNFHDVMYDKLPINNPYCNNCEALSLCGGGCSYQSELNSSEIDEGYCEYIKRILEWYLTELYLQSIK